MKYFIVVSALFLASCGLMPKAHDPVMFEKIITIEFSLNQANCEDKQWDTLRREVQLTQAYAKYRDDSQAVALKQLDEALDKAYTSKSKPFCESVLRINKERVATIINLWKER